MTRAGEDSLVAIRRRLGDSTYGADLALAERMARLVHHYVTTGLKHLPRAETVAEHVLWVADSLAAGRLLVWGRDVEAGRLEMAANVEMVIR